MMTINKKIAAIVLSFTAIVAVYAVINIQTEPVFADATVTVQALAPDGSIIMAPTQLSVASDYASTVDSSYTNDTTYEPQNSSGVTVLDVLFKAHAAHYGNSFLNNVSYYIDGSASYIEEMFHIPQGSGYTMPGIMYVVNGIQPNDGHVISWPSWNPPDVPDTEGYTTLAINQAFVKTGDVISLFFITSYNDLYSFDMDLFGDVGEDHGPDLSTLINSNAYTLSTLPCVYGYDVFSEGYMTQEYWNPEPIDEAEVYLVNYDSSTGTVNSTTLVGDTDEDGYIEITNQSALSQGNNCVEVVKSGVVTNFYTIYVS